MKVSKIVRIFFVMIGCMHCSVMYAGTKSVYIKGFLAENVEQYKAEKAKEIFISVFLNKNFRVNTDASFGKSLELEELKQTLKTYDEKQIKRLLSILDVDYIVYGFIRVRGKYLYITAKMLDKSENVELKRVKTIKIRQEIESQHFADACKVLAGYIIDGNNKAIQKYQDKLVVEERKYEIDVRNQMLINEKKLEDEKFEQKVAEYKKIRKQKIAGNKTFIRSGYNVLGARTKDDDFNNHFKRGEQFFIELVLPVIPLSYSDGIPLSGFDVLFRYTYFYYPYDKSQGPPVSDVYKKYWDDKKIDFHAFDIGLRYRLGLYFLMTKFDFYILASARKHIWPEKYEIDETQYNTEEVDNSSWGGIVGGGLEIAFFPRIGFFAEYNYGKSKIGKQSLDIESHQGLIGVTLRF